MKETSLQLVIVFLLVILIIINTINVVFSMMSQFPAWPTPPAEPLPLPSSNQVSPTQQPISTFEECVNAGYPVMESYPPQCNIPGGQTFVAPLQ